MSDSVSLVPHRVRYSFDVAHCVCGWYDTSDDQERLRAWGSAHDEAWWGHLVEMEEFVPTGNDDA